MSGVWSGVHDGAAEGVSGSGFEMGLLVADVVGAGCFWGGVVCGYSDIRRQYENGGLHRRVVGGAVGGL